ncbi:O-antigen ligase family protein [Thermopirellula anaerolimosa]
MSWAKATITLAATTAAFAITLRRLGEYGGIHFPELTHFFAYAPAFLLGLMYWLHCPTFARSRPVLLLAVVPIAGLTYANLAGGNTPLVVAAFLLMGLPIAAMMTVHRWWIPAARIFVFANVAALVLTLYLDHLVHAGSWGRILARFGFSVLSTGEASSNPNQMGGQFALAAVMAVILFLRSGRSPRDRAASGGFGDDDHCGRDWVDCLGAADATVFIREPNVAMISPRSAAQRLPDTASRRLEDAGGAGAKVLGWFSLAAAGPLMLGCFLTGSRGAGLALLASMGVLLLADARSPNGGRLRDLFAVSVFALWLGCLAVFLSGINPLERIQARLMGSEGASIRSLGSRLPIWENAFRAWTTDPAAILIGAGTGQAEIALGRLDAGAKPGDHGEYRRACHNMFIEWLLSYGIFGLLPGGWFYWACWRQASRLDRAEGTYSRRTLLLAVTLFGMTADLHRHFHWIFTSAWLLALLDPASLGTGMARSVQSQEAAIVPGQSLSLPRGGASWREFPEGRLSGNLPHADKRTVAAFRSIPPSHFPRVFQQ